MTVTIAPRWALSGLALHDEVTGWLQGGVDVRILVSPALGFPLHPFLVYPLGQIDADSHGHSAWAIQDSNGDPVNGPPFPVARDAPVYATLVDPGILSPFVWVEGAGDLVVDVIVDGPSGPTPVMTRSKPPWQLGGCRITRLRITGDGQVDDVRALIGRVGDLPDPVLVGLPVTEAARYQGLSDGPLRADLRVSDLQPRRVSLVDDPNDPPSIGVDESARVNVARDELDNWFIRIVDDPSAVVAEAAVVHRGPGPARAKPWTTTTDPVSSVLTAAWDRGLARWLGLHWTDDTPLPDPLTATPYWIYAISGLWAIDPDRRVHSPRFAGDDPPRLIDRLPTPVDQGEIGRILDAVPGLDNLVSQLPEGLVLMPLTAVVGAAIGAVPDLPSPPVIAGARQGPWRRAADGEARCTVAIGFAAPPPGSVALARRDPATGGLVPLGRQYRDGEPWRAPYAVGRPTDGSLPVEIWDHDAPEDPTEYAVARSDAMGRWSEWTPVQGPSIVRPAVPVPSISVTVPDVQGPPPAHDDPVTVQLRVDVAVPADREIELGGFGIFRVAISIDDGPETWFDLPNPPPERFTVGQIDGPALGRAETATTAVRARFEDRVARASDQSSPVVRTVRDPRPPHHVVLSGPLNYTGRPGRDGFARALLTWDASAGVSYRIYLAYAPDLRARLSGAGGQAIIDALDAAQGAGQLAAVWWAYREEFPQAAFHPVAHVSPPPGGGRFEHIVELPGGLPELAFVRVVPVSAALVEGDWAHAATSIFAVPDDRPPATPLLAVRAVPSGVEATITVGRGGRALARWQLRRRRSTGGPAVFMPIVAAGDIGPAPADGAPAPIVVVDPLDVPTDSVDRWVYVAQVQGADEDTPVDGQPRPTPWSPPSREAAVVLLLPSGPPAIATATAQRSPVDPASVEIRVEHDGRLASDLPEPYRIEAYRVEPGGQPPTLAAQLPANAAAVDGGRTADGTGAFVLTDTSGATATDYVVVVVDPIGRRSPALSVPVTP
jgi:hypothetical protein